MRLSAFLTVMACTGCRHTSMAPVSVNYAVYDSLLAPPNLPAAGAGAPHYVVEDEIGGGELGPQGLMTVRWAYGVPKPPVREEAIDDFVARGHVPEPVDASAFGRSDIALLNHHDAELILHDPHDWLYIGGRPPTVSLIDRFLGRPLGHAGFRRAWPGAAGIVELGPVGFSRDRRTAFTCLLWAGILPPGGGQRQICDVLVTNSGMGWSVSETFRDPDAIP